MLDPQSTLLVSTFGLRSRRVSGFAYVGSLENHPLRMLDSQSTIIVATVGLRSMRVSGFADAGFSEHLSRDNVWIELEDGIRFCAFSIHGILWG